MKHEGIFRDRRPVERGEIGEPGNSSGGNKNARDIPVWKCHNGTYDVVPKIIDDSKKL